MRGATKQADRRYLSGGAAITTALGKVHQFVKLSDRTNAKRKIEEIKVEWVMMYTDGFKVDRKQAM